MSLYTLHINAGWYEKVKQLKDSNTAKNISFIGAGCLIGYVTARYTPDYSHFFHEVLPEIPIKEPLKKCAVFTAQTAGNVVLSLIKNPDKVLLTASVSLLLAKEYSKDKKKEEAIAVKSNFSHPDEAPQELKTLIALAQRMKGNPESARRLCRLMPIGYILHGPPGTGKTELVKALAQITHIKLLPIDIASIGSSYLNQTAKNLKNTLDDIYQQIDPNEVAFAFIDEIDSIAFSRSLASQEDNKVITTLLQTIQGVHPLEKKLFSLEPQTDTKNLIPHSRIVYRVFRWNFLMNNKEKLHSNVILPISLARPLRKS